MPTDFESICEAVKRGEVVLFLGAGANASPEPLDQAKWTYPDNERPLFAGELAESLAEESGWGVRFDADEYPARRHFTRVTLDYELNIVKDSERVANGEDPLESYPVNSVQDAKELRSRGRSLLANRVNSAVNDGKSPSPALKGLAELNFPIVVTTNYDPLFLEALRSAGKNPTSEYYAPRKRGADLALTDFSPKSPFFFRIHGSNDDADSMVITDEDYIDFVLRMSKQGGDNPVPEEIYYRMKRWPTVFIGYSLSDYNLRLLLKTLRFGRDKFPPSFSIDPYPDSLIKRVWGDEKGYVTFVAQDIWSFVPALYKEIKGVEMP